MVARSRSRAVPCSPSRSMAARSPPSKGWPVRTASCTRCSGPSTPTTRCNAASVLPASSWQPSTCCGSTRTRARSRSVRAIPETAAGEVGRARLRKEDARLLTGRTRWTDNVTLPGMLHLAILRSPHAHAQISRIDVSGALAAPNVIAAFTGADVAERQGSLPCAWPVTEDMVHPNHPALAVDEVRHVGEAVAVVVARDRASAVDALEGVEVEYEPLPVVLDMEEALAEGTNKAYTWVLDSAEIGKGSSVSAAEAEVTVQRRYVQQRMIHSFIEPRSIVVDP